MRYFACPIIIMLVMCWAMGPVLNASEVTIADGNDLNVDPLFLSYANSLYECEYRQDELLISTGSIYGMAFYTSFESTISNLPVNIWLGTSAQSIDGIAWIPSTSLIQVFSGNISLPSGMNTINITFSEPYEYTGGYLVMLVERVIGSQIGTDNDKFFCQSYGNQRAKMILSNTEDIDPTVQYGSYSYRTILPKTTFYYTGQGITNDLACTGIIGNLTPTVGAPSNYTVTIKNNGITTQSGYSVQLVDSGGTMYVSELGEEIAAGQTFQQTITWTPTVSDYDRLYYGKVLLAGDEIEANNVSDYIRIYVKPEGENLITIGSEYTNVRHSRMPVDMYVNSSICQTLYYQEEIGLSGKYLTSITLYNSFVSNLLEKPTQLWLGSTALDDLDSGFIPVNELTQVFDGNVDYPNGGNEITIDLTTPFYYPGGNLVLTALRPMDTYYYSYNDYFSCIIGDKNRSRKATSYSSTVDPITPPLGTVSQYYPRIQIVYADQVINNDLGCNRVTGSIYPTSGREYEYTLTITNNAYNDQTDYVVKLMLEGGTEIASVSGTPISPMETNEYTFNWAPSVAGATSVYGMVVLAGDENLGNNQSEPLVIEVQEVGSVAVSIGSGTDMSVSPMGLVDYNTSIYECIYLANEICGSGAISQIKLYYEFEYARYGIPVKIWLGLTGQNDLTDGLIPLTALSLVFDGNLNFPAGIGTLNINLTVPFNYTGGNLAMLVFRPWDNQISYWGNFFFGEYQDHDRSYATASSTAPLDPTSLPLPSSYYFSGSEYLPNITFVLNPIYDIPTLSSYPGSVDFGDTRLGAQYTRNMWTTNVGPSPLVIESVSVTGSGSFAIQNLPQLPINLAGEETITFDIQFVPTSIGTHTGTINITDNTGRTVHTISVMGNCVDLTAYSIPYEQNFDSVSAPSLPLDWVGWIEMEGGAYIRTGNGRHLNMWPETISEPNCLEMNNMQNSNVDCILIGPRLSETININDLILSFYATQTSASRWITIGFVSDYDQPDSFQWVANKYVHYGWNQYYVDFGYYYGNNRHLAIRLGDNGQSLLIDDIKLSYEVALPQLISPNGGEVWTGGATEIIRWEPTDLALTLQISYDGGINWTDIEHLYDGEELLYFTVPAVNSTQCKIRLSAYQAQTLFDDSDAVFTIQSNPILPKVLMTFPNAQNLRFGVNEAIVLRWTRANVTSVSLDLSNDEGLTWQQFAAGIDADSLAWSVIDVPGHNCLIRVRPDAHPQIMDVTDYPFAIGKIEIVSPQANDVVYSGYNYGVETLVNIWGVDIIKQDFSFDGGATWAQDEGSIGLGINMQNPLVLEMRFGGVPSNNYLYRISDHNNQSIIDVVGPFEIRNPIKLTNANGGGFVTRNVPFTIRWLNQQVESDWSIWWEYSYNGSSWTRINTTATPVGPGTFIWTPNLNLDDSVWLQAVTSHDRRIIGRSEAPFVMTNKSLTLWSPSGGEEYLPQSTQTIYWEGSGLSTLNIDYSTDNGLSWTRIASNVPATQNSYQWAIPDTPSGCCLVKLSDTNYEYMNRTSDACFTILTVPNIPEITLTSSNNINFNTVYLGDTSAPQYIQIMNSGTGTLIIEAVSFYDPSNQFVLTDTILPLEILPQCSGQIGVVFIPTTNATATDSIFIHSNAVNLPILAIRLTGVGTIVPPAAVEGVEVTIVGDDAVITWLPVTETIYGTPITPDRYVLLCNETPEEDEDAYTYFTSTAGLSASHQGVTLFRKAMFYRVVAVKFYRDAEANILASLLSREKPITWGSLKELLRNAGRRMTGD